MSSNGWRKQGGLSNFLAQNSISVNSLSCDVFTLRRAYFGTFDICGEFHVSGNALVDNDVRTNNVSVIHNVACENLTVRNDTQNLGNITVTKDFTVSTGNIYVVNGNVDLSQNLFLRKTLYLGNSGSAFLFGTDSAGNTLGNIGINTVTPMAALDVRSLYHPFVLNVSSQQPTAYTVLSRTNANHCSVIYSDPSSARIDMFVDTAFATLSTIPDCRIQYSSGGNLVIDVSNNTDILSNVVISPDATRTVQKYGETLMVYSSSASSSLYQPYFYETAPGGIRRAEAITAVASVNNGLSFLNLVNQGDNVASNTGNTFGLSMGGGLYPWDTTQTMGTLGLIRPSATQSLQYIPAINVITGNNCIKSTKSTVSINNVRPETDAYSLDVNGPVHIKNGDVTMTYDAYNAEITMVAVSPSNPQCAVAVGSPVSLYSVTTPKRNQQIYYTTNGGNKWNTNLAGSANGIDDTFLETSSSFLPIRAAYVVDANLSFFAGKNNLYYSNTSGASWKVITMELILNPIDITSLYVYKTGAQTGQVYLCLENAPTIIVSFPFDASWYSSTTAMNVSQTQLSVKVPFTYYLIHPQFTISGSPSSTTTIFLSGYVTLTSTNYIYRIDNVGGTAATLSFTLIDTIVSSARITDIAAYGANTVVAVFDNGAVRSTVNGVTNSFFTSASALYGVTLFNNGISTIGIAVGKNGSIFYSVDTPLTSWTSIPVAVLNSGGNAANIVNPTYDLTSISNAIDLSTCQFYVVQRRAAYVDGITLGQSRIYHLYLPNLFSNSTNYVLDVSGTQRVSGDIQLNDGGRLTSANSVGYLFHDAPVSSIYMGGSASAITVGNSGNVNALTTIQSKLSVVKDATFQSSMSITGNVRVTTPSNGFMGAIFDNNVTSTGDILIGGMPNSALGLPVTRDPSTNAINTQRNIRIGNFTGSGDLSNNIYVGGPLDTVVLGGSVISSTSYKIGPAIYVNFASLTNSSANTGLFFGETGNASAGRLTISANGEGFLIRSTKSSNTVLLDTNALTYTGAGALNNAIVTLSKETGNTEMHHRLSTSSLDVSSVLVRNYALTFAANANAQIVDTPMRILGNVGIGTTSSGLIASGYVLDVSGNVNVSGRLTVQSGTVSLDSGNSIVIATGPTYNGNGAYNVCIGFSVMSSGSLTNTAMYNTGIGGYSLQSLTTGDKNVAIGAGAAKAITTGQFNTAIGVDSLIHTITGQNNVAIGYYSGQNSTGSNNTFLGMYTTGGAFSNSTAIGYGATINASNQIVLGTAAQTVVIPGNITGNSGLTVSNRFTVQAGTTVSFPANSIAVAAINGLATALTGFNSTGNVAINQTNATANFQLDVNGNLRVTGTTSFAANSIAVAAISGLSTALTGFNSTGNVAINKSTATTNFQLDVSGNAMANHMVSSVSASIGKSTDFATKGYALDVSGYILVNKVSPFTLIMDNNQPIFNYQSQGFALTGTSTMVNDVGGREYVFSFNGSSNYYLAVSPIRKIMTISFWVYNTTVQPTSRIVMNSVWFPIYYNAAGKLTAHIYYTGNGPILVESTVKALNTWHHYAVTISATRAILYVNGVAEFTDTTVMPNIAVTGGWNRVDPSETGYTNNGFYVGGTGPNVGTASIDGSANFVGRLDNIFVHNYALSASEVAIIASPTGNVISSMDVSGGISITSGGLKVSTASDARRVLGTATFTATYDNPEGVVGTTVYFANEITKAILGFEDVSCQSRYSILLSGQPQKNVLSMATTNPVAGYYGITMSYYLIVTNSISTPMAVSVMFNNNGTNYPLFTHNSTTPSNTPIIQTVTAYAYLANGIIDAANAIKFNVTGSWINNYNVGFSFLSISLWTSATDPALSDAKTTTIYGSQENMSTLTLSGGMNALSTQIINFGNNAPIMDGTNIRKYSIPLTSINGSFLTPGINSTGNIAINTTSDPTNNIQLDVIGNLRVTGSLSLLNGSITDSALTNNVPKMNVENTFTGTTNLNGNVTVASTLTAPVLIGSATLIALSGTASAGDGNVFGIGNVRVSYTGFSSVGTNLISLPSTNPSVGYYTFVLSYSGLTIASTLTKIRVQYNNAGSFYEIGRILTNTGTTIVQSMSSVPSLTGITDAANAFKFGLNGSVAYTFKSMVISVYYTATNPDTSPVLSTNNFRTNINSTLIPNQGLYATAQQVISFGDNAPVMSGANIMSGSVPLAALAGSVSTAGINSLGNVAINTTNLATNNIQLDVIGNLRVTGSLSLSNTSIVDTALSANVALKNAINSWSALNTFSNTSLTNVSNCSTMTLNSVFSPYFSNVTALISSSVTLSIPLSAYYYLNNTANITITLPTITADMVGVVCIKFRRLNIGQAILPTVISVASQTPSNIMYRYGTQDFVGLSTQTFMPANCIGCTIHCVNTNAWAISDAVFSNLPLPETATTWTALNTFTAGITVSGGAINFGSIAPTMSGANIANSSIPIAALAGSVNTTGINSTGNVAINQLNSAITSGYQIDVSGNARISGDTAIIGNISAASFTSSSDRRLKENIVPLVKVEETIANICPVFFDWIETGKRDCGFIAQNVFAELPYMNPFFAEWGVDAHDPITGNSIFYKLDYSKMTPHLWAAAQELYRENTQLKTKMREMETTLREMEERFESRLSRIESVMRMGSISL